MDKFFYMILVRYIKVVQMYQKQRIKIEKLYLLIQFWHHKLLIVLMLNSHKYKMNYLVKNKYI